MDFNFFMPVQVFSGESCLPQHAGVLRSLGRRCLVVTGRHSAKASGALDDVVRVLEEQNIDYTLCPAIGPNPLVSQCQTAACAAEACRADFLIGIGGGSVMDAVKAAAWLAANHIGDTDRLFAGTLRHPPLPAVLIGTTAGTGSEVSATAVLTLDDTGRKRSVTHPNCYARYVFADARYTASMSRTSTVSTALDALSHAVEGWFAPGCGDVITAFGEKALPLVSAGLRELAAAPDTLPDGSACFMARCGRAWCSTQPAPLSPIRSAISSPKISAYRTAWRARCSCRPSPGERSSTHPNALRSCLPCAAAVTAITPHSGR